MDDHAKKAMGQFPGIGDAFKTMAQAYCQDFVDYGLDPHRASSIVANIMLREAWIIAGSGKILHTGKSPDPAKFLEAAEAMMETVRFKDPAALGIDPQDEEEE